MCSESDYSLKTRISTITMKRFLLIYLCVILYSCGGKKNEQTVPDRASVIYKKDTSEKKTSSEPPRPPIINIQDTIALKRIVLVVRDSASNSQRIGTKLSRIYDSYLPAFCLKNKIRKTGPRMAWYKSSKAPFFFEAGFSVDKKPARLEKNMSLKNIGGDSAVVAHYYGPYESTYLAYQAITDWMHDYHKKSSAPPYEVYIGDPFDEKGKRSDPYKILTEIIFPRK